MAEAHPLPDAAFMVLPVLAEGPAHERMADRRGFRFWTRLGPASRYGALERLEAGRLIASALAPRLEGSTRRVEQTTEPDRAAPLRDRVRRRSRPDPLEFP